MPKQFEIAKNQLKREMKDSGKTVEVIQYGELLSKNLDNEAEEKNGRVVDEQTSKECFKDLIRHCEAVQRNIQTQVKQKTP